MRAQTKFDLGWYDLIGIVIVALAAIALAAAPARPDTTSLLSSFDSDADGWTGSGQTCSIPSGTGLCEVDTVYRSGLGNPPGSLATEVTVTLNLLGVFRGEAKWTSPSFTAPEGEITGATFQYERALDQGGLVSLAPTSDVEVTLVDKTDGDSTLVLSETLDENDTEWSLNGAGLPNDAVEPGHDYALEIDTATSTSETGVNVIGTVSTVLDDVALTVAVASTGGGPGGPGGGTNPPVVSPGVTIAGGPLSDSEMRKLMSRINENAEAGRGPGGSIVPLDRCTIVGTPGPDRITGSGGNDVICGLGGNDVIQGGGGLDLIDGANGSDRLSGGPRADLAAGLRGNDRVRGQGGNDRLGGGAGKDSVGGGAGRDRLGGGTRRDRLLGGGGRDRLHGGRGSDRLRGGGGSDRLRARDRGKDSVDGGPGRDLARVDRARGARGRGGGASRADRVRRVERLR